MKIHSNTFNISTIQRVLNDSKMKFARWCFISQGPVQFCIMPLLCNPQPLLSVFKKGHGGMAYYKTGLAPVLYIIDS